MYYCAGSQPIADTAKTRSVYLPQECGWFDFWSNRLFQGGQTIAADAPLDKIPLYARAGSIVPMTEAMQYADEIRDAPYETRIYCGADAEFVLYEDAGDGYEYEANAFALTHMTWNEARHELSISAREGTFLSLVHEREYRIVFISEHRVETQKLQYSGNAVRLRAAERIEPKR